MDDRNWVTCTSESLLVGSGDGVVIMAGPTRETPGFTCGGFPEHTRARDHGWLMQRVDCSIKALLEMPFFSLSLKK